jgi:hypothetical protein
MDSGDIHRHDRFYRDPEFGELLPKYIVFLAPTRSGDWVARLLTSRENVRQRVPACFHGDPYPGYFLGVPGPPLTFDTWVDLRAFSDLDAGDVRALLARGVMRRIGRLPGATLAEVIDCTAGAADTTKEQERALRDELARLR